MRAFLAAQRDARSTYAELPVMRRYQRRFLAESPRALRAAMRG